MRSKHNINYFNVWALITVCSIIGGAVVAGLVGGLIGLFGFLGAPLEVIDHVVAGLGFIIALATWYFFFRLFVSRLIVRKLTEDSDETPAA